MRLCKAWLEKLIRLSSAGPPTNQRGLTIKQDFKNKIVFFINFKEFNVQEIDNVDDGENDNEYDDNNNEYDDNNDEYDDYDDDKDSNLITPSFNGHEIAIRYIR